MLPKERVFTALSHKEPDRVPTALWGGPYGLVDPLYHRLLDLLEIGEPLAPIRQGHTINYIDDRILTALDTDIRFIWPGASPTSPTHITPDNEDIILDDFGQPWKKTSPYYSATEGLLKNTDSLDAIEELVKWPDVNDPKWTQGVSERTHALKDSDHFIIGRMVVSHGPFQMACDLRSMENFLMDMAINQNFAHALLEKVTETICGLIENYLQESDGIMDMIELPGDDYASNDNLVFSPIIFRELIKPCIKTIIAKIKEVQPDIKIMLHSDGAVEKLIPDFIEMGIEVLHPLEPVVGMDPAIIKQKFGKSISFLGGVDITQAMPGTILDVRHDVDRCLRDLSVAGGYILAPSNHLQHDVPPENVVELYRYAKVAGIY